MNANPSDPRIDKIVSWVLMGFSGVALSIGAWFFNGLSTEIRSLSNSVHQLKTEVAVQREQQKQIESISTRLQNHCQESGHPAMVRMFERLSDRVVALEAGARENR